MAKFGKKSYNIYHDHICDNLMKGYFTHKKMSFPSSFLGLSSFLSLLHFFGLTSSFCLSSSFLVRLPFWGSLSFWCHFHLCAHLHFWVIFIFGVVFIFGGVFIFGFVFIFQVSMWQSFAQPSNIFLSSQCNMNIKFLTKYHYEYICKRKFQ